MGGSHTKQKLAVVEHMKAFGDRTMAHFSPDLTPMAGTSRRRLSVETRPRQATRSVYDYKEFGKEESASAGANGRALP